MTHFRRIEAFLSSLGGESIDTKFPRIEGKRADYLLFDRTVIVEIKNLEDSRVEAVEKVLWKWLVRPGDPIPIFYGNWDRVRSGSALIAAQLLAIGGGFDLVLSRQNHPLMPVVGARKRAGASRRWLLTPESDRPPTLPREASHW